MDSRKKPWTDLAMIALLILFPHFVPLPFYSYALVCFAAILFYLKKNRLGFHDLGLSKRNLRAMPVFAAVVSAFAWVAFMRWVFIPLITHFFTVPDYTEYDFIRNHPGRLAIAITASWIVGGVYEELAFRGVIQNIVSNYLRPVWSAITVSGLLFGLYHWQQGIFGIAAATLGGIYWGLLYWKSGKNLWIPIISHSLFDTVTLLLIYFGLFGNR